MQILTSDLGRNLLGVASALLILMALGSFVSAHVDDQNQRQTAYQALSLLNEEITRASQSATSTSPLDSGATRAPNGVLAATARLHDAMEHWAKRDYGEMTNDIEAGYRQLGYDDVAIDLELGHLKSILLSNLAVPKGAVALASTGVVCAIGAASVAAVKNPV